MVAFHPNCLACASLDLEIVLRLLREDYWGAHQSTSLRASSAAFFALSGLRNARS
jgi:hypothetical protein